MTLVARPSAVTLMLCRYLHIPITRAKGQPTQGRTYEQDIFANLENLLVDLATRPYSAQDRVTAHHLAGVVSVVCR